MKDQQPTCIRGTILEDGGLFSRSGWWRCLPVGAQMGILYRCVMVCPRRRQKQILRTHMLSGAKLLPRF